MPRTVLMHANVQVPDDDGRSTPELVQAVEAALQVGSDDDTVRHLEVVMAEVIDDSGIPEWVEPDPVDDKSLAVWFTPDAIRDSFDSVDDDSEAEEVRRRAWVESATEAQLRAIGEGCISSDSLWSLFHELIQCEVDAAMATNQTKEEA